MGKVIVITGAGSGLGRAIARRLGISPARVATEGYGEKFPMGDNATEAGQIEADLFTTGAPKAAAKPKADKA